MKIIDLRSDTVTKPTEEMRRVMFEAAVGDDVYADDPTVNELEAVAAEILGKQAALFIPSGTMGNQICIMTHTKRGDEVLTVTSAHIVNHEAGAMAVLSGVLARSLTFKNDIPDANLIKRYITAGLDDHVAPTGLISYENPTSSGRVVPVKTMAEIYEAAQNAGIPVHIDGARIFNAAAYLNADVRELTKNCDSVMACVSKGLCAPVGSVIAGETAFIARARKNRKLLGGGMRQAGVIAAPAILALTEMTKRLDIDHQNAKHLAKRLSGIPGVTVDLDAVEINMVFFRIDLPENILDSLPGRLKKRGIIINGHEQGLLRFVTHNDVSRDDLDVAAEVLKEEIFG
jgi:threonine aldolase